VRRTVADLDDDTLKLETLKKGFMRGKSKLRRRL
jgi:hypothetical protein